MIPTVLSRPEPVSVRFILSDRALSDAYIGQSRIQGVDGRPDHSRHRHHLYVAGGRLYLPVNPARDMYFRVCQWLSRRVLAIVYNTYHASGW